MIIRGKTDGVQVVYFWLLICVSTICIVEWLSRYCDKPKDVEKKVRLKPVLDVLKFFFPKKDSTFNAL